jgi:diaminopimelate epimerase
MIDVENYKKEDWFYFLDTGSPHHIMFVNDVKNIDVYENGKKIRYSEMYEPDGTNVNFVQINGNTIFVRTYERGVEDETLSCGTGVTASAIATYIKTGKKPERIETTGGNFRVDFNDENGKFTDIWLKGPAEMVFKGEIAVP